MKTTAKTNVAGWLASGLIMASTGMVSAAVPSQSGTTASAYSSFLGETPAHKTDNMVLAKRTGTARYDTRPETAPAKPKESGQTHAKANIGRCWKRLMDNLREVRQAHRNRTK